MTQVKNLDFAGITIFCGVDMHKKNWRVNVQDSDLELEDFNQDPDAVLLHKHLSRKYPGANFKIGYEAGFCGFSAQRLLANKGMNCLVINAADVATNDKEKRQKNDKIDARKLCDHLQNKKVKGVYIPELHWEHGRSLVRARARIVGNQTRCKNRIWHLLHFSGLKLPGNSTSEQYWSKRFVAELHAIECGSEALKTTLELYIQDYQQTRVLLLEATRAIRKLCTQPEYKRKIWLLMSIPGIGEINAAVMLFELQDINRFKHFDPLSSYAGLIPSTHDSGDRKTSKGITDRTNQFLRAALVESSWTAVRKDPALLIKYKEYLKRMNKNKAIIRIAKHLLSRIQYVLKNDTEYITGVVA
jgi:transposase